MRRDLTAKPGVILPNYPHDHLGAMKRISVACLVLGAAQQIRNYGNRHRNLESVIAETRVCNQFRCKPDDTKEAVFDYFRYFLGDLTDRSESFVNSDIMEQIIGAATQDLARARKERELTNGR